MYITNRISENAHIINLCAGLFATLIALWFISLEEWGYAAFNVGLAVINFFMFWLNRRDWRVRTNDRS